MSDSDRTIERFNQLSVDQACQEMLRCCGAVRWCQAMVSTRPFNDRREVHLAADQAFAALSIADWLEAFLHHPKIGDIQSLRMKFTGNREWSAGEQAGISDSEEAVIASLAKGNQDYVEKFGFIFIVCATGKTATELLSILQSRLPLDRETEINNASIEQKKITHLRIDKWEIKS
jgi:2-oxo-4-hydroxy-4-carboxy-5-ureidoimidazoline decarboxylase